MEQDQVHLTIYFRIRRQVRSTGGLRRNGVSGVQPLSIPHASDRTTKKPVCC